MRPAHLAALLAVFWLFPARIQAANDEIWSAVILATRESPAKPPPRKIAPFAPELERVFGYNSFYLIGQKEADIYEGDEKWLLPSKRIFLKTQILSRDSSRYLLRIDLYDDKSLLVSTEAKLARDAPLIIRGPRWGKGQLIALVAIK